jgi:hypothetical protein
MEITQKILKETENNTLKWYGHVVRIGTKRWLVRIFTCSQEGRKRRRKGEKKWEMEVKRVTEVKNPATEDAVNRKKKYSKKCLINSKSEKLL